jgi:hypothetical protein
MRNKTLESAETKGQVLFSLSLISTVGEGSLKLGITHPYPAPPSFLFALNIYTLEPE